MKDLIRKLLHIKKHWFLSLFLLLGVILLLVFTFNLFPEIKEEEKLNIFIVSEIVNSEFNEELENKVNNNFKEVVITHSSLEDYNLEYLFSTKGALSTDLFILPESFAKETNLASFFLAIENDNYSNYLIDNEIKYGILLSKYEDNRYLKDYIGFYDEDFYILINANSKFADNLEVLYDAIDKIVGGF